jgi:hypothetical protein
MHILILFLAQAQQPATAWVPFSAELTLHRADGTTASGRFFQDEHGCERKESPTGPRGTTVITIQNFEQQKFYQSINDRWTVQPMRLGPGGTRVPRDIRGVPLGRTLEGYALFEQQINLRLRDGTTTVRRNVVVPELNHFIVEQTIGVKDGDVMKAHAIKKGPPDPSLFVPPPGAVVTEREGFGGAMRFHAVELQIRFAGREPVNLVTTELTPSPTTTPGGETLFVVTEADDRLERVTVRIMRNATGQRGTVRGDVLEIMELPLGASSPTTKLAENFEIRVVRIGMNVAR